jgi:hypothetical protein
MRRTMDAEAYLEVERMSKLGWLGEQLAAECLLRAGFTDVRNLNQGTNFRYADIVARSADIAGRHAEGRSDHGP